MNHQRSMSHNMFEGLRSDVNCSSKYFPYGDWSKCPHILINADDMSSLKIGLLVKLDNNVLKRLREIECEIEFAEECHIIMGMKRTSVLNIHPNILSARQM